MRALYREREKHKDAISHEIGRKRRLQNGLC